MKIKLASDFIDIYDCYFCGSWEVPDKVFKRNSKQGMNRIDMMYFLKNTHKLLTPDFGFVANYNCAMGNDVIIFKDINSHRGEDRVKIKYSEAEKHYKNYFFTSFIKTKEQSTSYRFLQIGRHMKYSFWLKYQSDHEWLSNNGEVSIEFIEEQHIVNPCSKIENSTRFLYNSFNYPVYAIDFIKDENNFMYAVDFNISPGLKNIGIERYMSNKQIYEEIYEWFLFNG